MDFSHGFIEIVGYHELLKAMAQALECKLPLNNGNHFHNLLGS
jgi:hypothetical protein